MRKGIFLQLPGMATWGEIERLGGVTKELGFQGATMSLLPSNHDAFKLLASIARSFDLEIGVVIVSPLLLPVEALLRSIEELAFSIDVPGFIVLGVGDPQFLKSASLPLNPIVEFKKRTMAIRDRLEQTGCPLNLFLAGSGKEILQFSRQEELPLLFNGRIAPEVAKSLEVQNIFLVSHFGNEVTISLDQREVLTRILENLPPSDPRRTLPAIKKFKSAQKGGFRPSVLGSTNQSLNYSLINEVAYLGSSEGLRDLVERYFSQMVSRIILSHSPTSQWSQI